MKKLLVLFICFIYLFSCTPQESVFSSLVSVDVSVETGCNHHFVKTKGIEPSCYEVGLTEGELCAKCGLVLKEQEIIKPSHNFKLTKIHLEKHDDIEKPGTFECQRCDKVETREITYHDIKMPIITIKGNLASVTKESKTKLRIKYQEETTFESKVTFKLQGSSSLAYPKKNYNIQFLNEADEKEKVLLHKDWSKQSKYCLKANFIDYSQARNVVSGKIYGDIVHYRNFDDEFNNLVNGGAIDGFPVLCYSNDSYLGLYTLNIPKDEWLFDMKDEETNAILMADSWTESCFLQEEINQDFSNGWDVEYCEYDTNVLRNNFNNVIREINNNNLSHVYVDRAIDAMLYTMLICGRDNYSKNILWATYDGKTFMPSVYDMDATWGLNWDGKSFNEYNEFLIDEVLSSWNCNELWKKLFSLFPQKVYEAYFSLREGPLHLSNITKRFIDFID